MVIYYPPAPALARHGKSGHCVLRQTLCVGTRYPLFLPLSMPPSPSLSARLIPLSDTLSVSLLPLSYLPSVFFYQPLSFFCCFFPLSVSLFIQRHAHAAQTRGRGLSLDISVSGDIQTTLDCECVGFLCLCKCVKIFVIPPLVCMCLYWTDGHIAGYWDDRQ